jgi:hypothetical protein
MYYITHEKIFFCVNIFIMANTDVRISDLTELSIADSGDLFAVVETGTANATRKYKFGSLSGQIFDPLSEATGRLSTATGALSTATGALSTATGQLSLRHLYSVHAEEESALSTSNNNGFQWSFGNGVRTVSGKGFPIVFASKLVGFGFQGDRDGGSTGNVSVEVYKAATPTLVSGTLTTSNEIFTTEVSPPIDFEAGSTLNFKTNESEGSLDNGIAVAYFVTTNTPFNF